MGSRINTVMQPCFFQLSGVLPADEAIARIKQSVEETYGRRGRAIVERNFAAIDRAVERLRTGRRPRRSDQPAGVWHRPSRPTRRTSCAGSRHC